MPRTRDKNASHDRIVQAASARVRRDGADRLNVTALMQEAGLTHGGFYRHFASREALVEAAIASALQHSRPGVTGAGGHVLRATIESYVSQAHRDHPDSGCGVAALAGDVARGSGANKAAYAARVRSDVEFLTAALADAETDDVDARRDAIALLSEMVGAVIIARAAAGSEISDEILDVVRDRLTSDPGSSQ
jgi:TetR/AcrR family transcriptional repressor of nem operon